jgi:hypothetical protein
MISPSLIIGSSNWAVKSGSLLGYEYGELSGQYNPIPITGSRASSATYTDQTGAIVSASSNILRVDYTYSTSGSLLLEPQRTNLYLRSQEFAVSPWDINNTSITANSTTSPDGNVNGSLFSANGTTSIKNLLQIVSVTSGSKYTMSIYAKKNTNDFIQITSTATFLGSTTWANFDLNNGVLGTVGPGGTATITSVGNGWYRCTLTGTATTTGTQNGGFYIVSSSTSARGESNSLDTSVYIWQAQLEQGSYATTLIPTTSTTVTRVADDFSRGNIYTDGYITSGGGTWLVELENNVAYIRDAFSNGLQLADNNSSGGVSGNGFTIRNGFATPSRL